MKASPKIYLDYAATTPVDPEVLRAMRPYFSERFGNAGSLHSFGQEAIGALDAARETAASTSGAEFREIIFTGSATEANNLAIRGSVLAGRKLGRKNARVIVSAVEHESILETARDLEKDGIDVVYLPVNKIGVVDLKTLEKSLNRDTILVSVVYANNEIGTIQPVSEIAKIVGKNHHPLFHVDASQAFQFLNCAATGADLMTLSSHKIYGPKGAGALYIKDGTSIQPVLMGGGQEFGLRAGTENIPAIVGFAEAMRLADAAREKEAKRINALRAELWRGIKGIYPPAEVNGVSPDSHGDSLAHNTLPSILNVYFPGHHAQDLLTRFDLLGLAASSGSACRARASSSSYVIEALGYPKKRAKESVRFSLGRPTTRAEIRQTLSIIKKTVQPLDF